jgi:K+-transporting ATPase KdpF subunit
MCDAMTTLTMLGGVLALLLLGYLIFALLYPEKLS